MKTLLALIFVITMPSVVAEGVASMTLVTSANVKNLKHHDLTVVCKSQRGKTFVDMTFRPNPKNLFGNCRITAYNAEGKKILFQIDPTVRQAAPRKGLHPGKRVYFHVADELVDQIEIMYHLSASAVQSHVFTIRKGELRKLAGLLH